MEEETPQLEHVWDPKRVGIGLLFLAVLLVIFCYTVGQKILKLPSFSYQPPKKAVTGISDHAISSSSIDLNKKVATIKQEMQNINVQDIATNSPQVQKVMQDLQALQSYPKVQTKGICQQICKGL